MKYVKIIISLVLLAAGISFLTGCFGVGAITPSELMRQPKLKVNQQIVKEVVNEKLTKDETLYTPGAPEDLSAINFADLDGDGVGEAVVYYKNRSTYRLGAYILRNEGETWQMVSKIESSGVDIAYGGFFDLTGDGRKEILMTWSADKSDVFLDKYMTVYSYGETVRELYHDSYTELVVGDFDNDKAMEMMLFNLNRNMDNPSSTGELVAFREGGFRTLDKINLDPYINGYYNVLAGPASFGKTGIFLDMGIGAHAAATYLLVVEDDEIINVFNSPGSSFYSKTAKAYAIESQDINGDGIIEIGTYEEPYGNTLSMAETPWIINWHQWDGKNNLKLVMQNYLDYESNLRIDFAKEWMNRVTVRFFQENGKSIEIAFVDGEASRAYPLYRIHSIAAEGLSGMEAVFQSDYFVAKEENGRIYIVEKSYEDQEPPFRIRQEYMETVIGDERVKALVKTWR